MGTTSRPHAIARTRPATLALLLTSVMLLAFAAPASADDPKPRVPLSLVLLDYADAPSPVLREAMDTAARIFRATGVEITWTRYSEADLERAADNPWAERTPSEGSLFVQLLSNAMTKKRKAAVGVLGQATPGTQIAWVLTPRVKDVAREERQRFGELLGHVIAHEIGHLLLPSGSHTAAGLMAASMNLDLIARTGLNFSKEHGDLIRARLTAGIALTRVAVR